MSRRGAPPDDHATTVANNMYGNTSSIAPGITDIYLYDANHWLVSGFLRVGQGAGNPPLIPPADIKVFNHSWIGDFGSPSLNNQGLRRSDFEMQRDNLLMVVGVNNGGASFPLMSHTYNGLAVGLTNGGHTSDATMAGIDGPGRLKPEIVAPSGVTTAAGRPALGKEILAVKLRTALIGAIVTAIGRFDLRNNHIRASGNVLLPDAGDEPIQAHLSKDSL